MNILFWNLYNKDLQNEIIDLVTEHELDFFMFAEADLDKVSLLRNINSNVTQKYIDTTITDSNFSTFSRLPRSSIIPLREESSMSVYAVKPPLSIEIIIVIVHIPSKIHRDIDQKYIAIDLIKTINSIEDDRGHMNTMIIGDFNMDPHEESIVHCMGFHAIMDQNRVKSITRKVYGSDKYFFYNPMWNIMGDSTNGPPGSYYYNRGGYVNYYWHMFDQVLLRPSLTEYFDIHNLKILTKAGNNSLISRNGIINKQQYSDHLPLFLNLNIERSAI